MIIWSVIVYNSPTGWKQWYFAKQLLHNPTVRPPSDVSIYWIGQQVVNRKMPFIEIQRQQMMTNRSCSIWKTCRRGLNYVASREIKTPPKKEGCPMYNTKLPLMLRVHFWGVWNAFTVAPCYFVNLWIFVPGTRDGCLPPFSIRFFQSVSLQGTALFSSCYSYVMKIYILPKLSQNFPFIKVWFFPRPVTCIRFTPLHLIVLANDFSDYSFSSFFLSFFLSFSG